MLFEGQGEVLLLWRSKTLIFILKLMISMPDKMFNFCVLLFYICLLTFSIIFICVDYVILMLYEAFYKVFYFGETY